MWTVSPKVIRENGPVGSCLTQMSDDAPRASVHRERLAVGRERERADGALRIPGRVHRRGGAIPVHPPARWSRPRCRPMVYTSVPLADTAKFDVERRRRGAAVHQPRPAGR